MTGRIGRTKRGVSPLETSTLAVELDRVSINLANMINAVTVLDQNLEFATALKQAKVGYRRVEKLIKKCKDQGLLPL